MNGYVLGGRSYYYFLVPRRKTIRQRNDYTVTVEGQKGCDITLFISGRIVLENIDEAMSEIRLGLEEVTPAKLTVDLSGIDYLDTAGAMILLQMESETHARSIPFEFVRMAKKTKGIMNLLDSKTIADPPLMPKSKTPGIFEQVGVASLALFSDIVLIVTFLGELLFALAHCVMHPRSVRWGDVLFYMKRAGVEGLPIVGLISLLLGLIIAFMSSLQLRQFGGNIFVASLVGVAIVKELGPIMTAVVVAGRSGSAFAAEIGTMMVNEEVDALVTMGFEPIRFLAVPKVIAAMVVVPVLTLYADLFGIGGGLIVGVAGLDLTVFSFVRQIHKTIKVFDIVSSLAKSVVFAMLIAGIACQRGFQTRGGANAVGASTTAAVVSAIFFIVVADSAFAIILHYIK